jgi:hypothetical protein
MTTEQKAVAIGAASGVACMALVVWGLYQVYPTVAGADDVVVRLVFALKMNVLAVIPLFVWIAMVGNARFLSDAIDPLRHAENKKMEVDGRVVDNTLQQNVVFLVGTLTLSTLLSADSVKVIAALTTVFIIARVLFWIGYRINPIYRAFGMAATAYMNVGILATCVYLMFFA